MTRDPRKTPGYAAWVRQVLKHCDPTCIRCGYPVDMTLPPSNQWGPTADHEPPLVITGEATPGLDGAGIAHNKCNKSHGGRLGAARAQTHTSTRPPKKKTNTMTNKPSISPTASVFSTQSKPPPAPCCEFPQEGAVDDQNGALHARVGHKVASTDTSRLCLTGGRSVE